MKRYELNFSSYCMLMRNGKHLDDHSGKNLHAPIHTTYSVLIAQ